MHTPTGNSSAPISAKPLMTALLTANTAASARMTPAMKARGGCAKLVRRPHLRPHACSPATLARPPCAAQLRVQPPCRARSTASMARAANARARKPHR